MIICNDKGGCGASRMRPSAVMLLFVVLAGASCGPAVAGLPHFSQTEPIPAIQYEAVTLRLLQGDGLLFSDPLRAVVVSNDGRLLAASPISASLGIICEGAGPLRRCFAYDELTRTVYQPVEGDWQDGGVIDLDGKPQNFPEDLTFDFGFASRTASLGEVLRFELTGILSSWWTTGLALVWWTSFWLLLLPVARFLLRRGGPRTIGTLVTLLLRTVGALLMIPVTAYAWLMAPYSGIYLAFVVVIGAMAAHLMTVRRSVQYARSAS